MRVKKFFYSVLLILFIIILAADLAVWFLLPGEAEALSAGESGFSFALPEGMSMPEDVTPPTGSGSSGSSFTLPEGLSMPEGMTPPTEGGSFTPPEGMSMPEGMTFPSGSGTEGSMSFPGSAEGRERPQSDESSESGETEIYSLPEITVAGIDITSYLTKLLPLMQMVRPYKLYILIASALGIILCIIRLIFINRKIRQKEEAEETDPVSVRKVSLWPAMLLMLGALGLVMFLFPGNETEEEDTDGAITNAKVLSGTVEKKDLTSLIQSTGSLEEQETVSLTIPTSVTVESVCVHNGDTVTAGQIVGKVDKLSAMKAIVSINQALTEIDSQLQKAHEAREDSTIKAPADGIVKVVYAEVGEKVVDVMNEHGSLMLLSLDGHMAVQVPTAEGLSAGDSVTVTLADGREISGQVEYSEEGIATVTVVDRGYAIGEQVSVKTGSGELLGSGPLSVHKPLNITGYLGTITRIYSHEGNKAYAGNSVVALSNTADLAEYLTLLQQRAEYEEELKTLFEMHQTGYIHAPCDGVIEGLSDDLTYASLNDVVAGFTVRHLGSTPSDSEPVEFLNMLMSVKEVNDDGTLYVINIGQVNLSTYSSLPKPSTGGTIERFSIPSVPIFTCDGGTISASDIIPGDRVLITFDQEGNYHWIVVQHAGDVFEVEDEDEDENNSPSGGRPGSFGGGGGFRFSSGSRGSSSSGSGSKQQAYTIAERELCTVTPQEKMLMVVSIDELDILGLSLGQDADLYLDAIPNKGFTATVTEIDEEGENEGGNTKYYVTLALDRESQMYPGMNGTVCFPRSEKKEALTVPLAALKENGGEIVIYTAYNEETGELLSPVKVQTGISDGTDVEIVSGLALGDAYYYRYADAISYMTE